MWSLMHVPHLVVWSGWGAEWAQGRFTWCWGWVITQGRGLHLSRGLWMSGGPFPLSGACRNVPVVDTSHVCNLFPSWRQVGVCLEWLLAPNIWWKKIVNGWMEGVGPSFSCSVSPKTSHLCGCFCTIQLIQSEPTLSYVNSWAGLPASAAPVPFNQPYLHVHKNACKALL